MNIIITIYSVNGYSGYVALSALCGGGPACEAGKLGFSFNPGTVYVPAGGYATSTMTITADEQAPVGSINTVRIIWGGCEQWDKQLHNDHRERDQVEAAQEKCEELQTMLEHSF